MAISPYRFQPDSPLMSMAEIKVRLSGIFNLVYEAEFLVSRRLVASDPFAKSFRKASRTFRELMALFEIPEENEPPIFSLTESVPFEHPEDCHSLVWRWESIMKGYCDLWNPLLRLIRISSSHYRKYCSVGRNLETTGRDISNEQRLGFPILREGGALYS